MGKKIYIGSDQIGTGGSGSGIDLQTLDASLKEYTYNKAWIDSSIRNHKIYLDLINEGFLIHDASIVEMISDLDDVSTRLSQTSGADLTNYYTKSQIDASFVTLDSSMSNIYAYAADVSSRVAQGGGGSTPDLTNYATKSDISTFKPIQYVNLSTYEENVSDGTIDQDTMYVITDLADSDELATLVTVDDLSTAKAKINASLNDTAEECINYANTSINYWKTTIVNNANTSINSIKNTAINNINTAKNNANTSIGNAKTQAISDISTAADTITANMKNFVVLSDASYGEIQTIDPNTIYFITD